MHRRSELIFYILHFISAFLRVQTTAHLYVLQKIKSTQTTHRRSKNIFDSWTKCTIPVCCFCGIGIAPRLYSEYTPYGMCKIFGKFAHLFAGKTQCKPGATGGACSHSAHRLCPPYLPTSSYRWDNKRLRIYLALHCKKGLVIFLSPAGYGKSRLGTGKSLHCTSLLSFFIHKFYFPYKLVVFIFIELQLNFQPR